MRTKAIAVVIAVAVPIVAAPVLGQQKASVDAPPDVQSLIAFSSRAEGETIGVLREGAPLVEWVVQVHVPVEPLGFVPHGDYYDLGRFKWTDAPRLEELVSRRSTTGERSQPPATGETQLRDALVEIMAPDWSLLSPQRYKYTFVRTMFLGSVRCYVFDVAPLNPDDGAFIGRVYIESKMFHIVRFTGVNRQVDTKLAAYFGKDASFRVDVWRLNVNRTRWLPAYAYIEEVARLGDPVRPLLRGQGRFWGLQPIACGRTAARQRHLARWARRR